jgi:hypothetical protein
MEILCSILSGSGSDLVLLQGAIPTVVLTTEEIRKISVRMTL